MIARLALFGGAFLGTVLLFGACADEVDRGPAPSPGHRIALGSVPDGTGAVIVSFIGPGAESAVVTSDRYRIHSEPFSEGMAVAVFGVEVTSGVLVEVSAPDSVALETFWLVVNEAASVANQPIPAEGIVATWQTVDP